jgi:hypothetical protein
MQLIRIGYNHDTIRKLGNLIVVLNEGLKKFQLGFSSEIEVPQLGSAGLGTFIARARARAGKFQLELISMTTTFSNFDGPGVISFLAEKHSTRIISEILWRYDRGCCRTFIFWAIIAHLTFSLVRTSEQIPPSILVLC